MAETKPTILVTGGCGYIGSHVTCQLSEAGYKVLVVDNLSTGHKDALLYGEELIVGDIGDEALLEHVFSYYSITSILHFAASIIVTESIAQPVSYYENNAVKTLKLLKHARRSPSLQHIVFSSTAAIYGHAKPGEALAEETPPLPIHPYGRSKLMDEWLLADIAKVSRFRYLCLRYFNVAGADPGLRIGQRGPTSTHLIKIACEAASGKRDSLAIFGNDYETPDGTCIRDYIHVADLAAAHLSALRYLQEGGESLALNCGYNRGFSVKEVIKACEEVLGRSLPVTIGERRAGDVPYLVAKTERDCH